MRISSRPGLPVVGVSLAFVCLAGAACSASPDSSESVGASSQAVTAADAGAVFPKSTIDALLESGDWNDAYAGAQAFLAASPGDCSANYAALIASSMMVVDSINTFVLPTERSGPFPPAVQQQLGQLFAGRLGLALQAAQ